MPSHKARKKVISALSGSRNTGTTMVFRASDPDMLKAVKAGDKVKFEPDRINRYFTITKIDEVK